MTDTTTEAVGRLIASATSEPWEVDACNMMAALAQERDAARDEVAALMLRITHLEKDKEATRAERDAARMCAEAEAEIANEMKAERDAARAEVKRLREALEMIAGRRQCIDNLLSNQAIARLALDEPSAALAAKEGVQ